MFETLQRDGGLATAPTGFMLADPGRRRLAELGFAPGTPNRQRRSAYPCLDWSECRVHLAGQLADEIYRHCTARGWLARGDGRAVALTPRGRVELLPRLASGEHGLPMP